MKTKKFVSLFMAVVMMTVCASFPTFSAEASLVQLTGDSLVDTDVVHKSFSDPDRLFDGDTSASHANVQGATDPDGNGVFGYMWLEAGETNYITIDLGGIYDLSQINTYWGWAPQAKPIWNNWEYAVPASYSIYISNSLEELESATPAKTVSGLSENSNGIADVSTANFTAMGRYVKIVMTYGYGGCFALRELEIFGVEKLPISSLGASIRLEDEETPAGLRFGAKVDKKALGIEGNWVYDENADFEFGMYLLPEDMLGDNDTLTEYLKSGENQTLKVVAKKTFEQTEDAIVYTAVLTNIPESEFETSIAAVPYFKSGSTITYFKEMTKSYMSVAVAAKKSYENGNPNNITAEQYASLVAIVGSNDEWINIRSVSASLELEQNEWNEISVESMIDGVNREKWDGVWSRYKTTVVDASATLNFTLDLGEEYNIGEFLLRVGGNVPLAVVILGTNRLDGNFTDWTVIGGTDSDTITTSFGEEGGWTTVKQGTVSHVGKYRYISLNLICDEGNIEVFEIALKESNSTETDPTEYYDIDAAAQAKGLNYNNATLPASLFVETEGSYLGYKIDGTYKVDADTLRMLTTVDCIGNGTLKYKDYNSFTDYIADKSYGEGYGPHCYGEQITLAPVSKLSDPMYMSMVLPSEGKTYMDVLYPNDPRNNGNNMHAVCTVSGCTRCNKVEYVRLNALGAFYLNQNKKSELENYKEVQFKLCLGNIRLFINTASGGWQQVKIDATPTSGNGYLYCLPWALEWNDATSQTYLNSCKSLSRVTKKTNYSEITLSVSDFFFSKTFTGTDGKSYTIDERVFHFWGSQYNIANDDDILGIVASYDMWIEYDESIGIKLEDYFISSIGADWRYSNGSGGYITRQAFAGYKHAVSTEKITVYGHNLTPSNYDSLMPSTAITYFKNTLGIK